MVFRTRFMVGTWIFLAVLSPATTNAGSTWLQPPQVVLDVLRAPELPVARLSPAGEDLLLARPLRYPPIIDLAQPMLRLAGVRINPRTNGRYAEGYFVGLTLKRVADGNERAIDLPSDARVTNIQWSADGKRFAFQNQVADGIELMVGDVATGRVHRIPDLKINPILYSEVSWMPDQKRLLVKRVPPGRGKAPEKPLVPLGPDIRESSGQSASSTYEARDVLTSPYDEALFEHYALAQLALVDPQTDQITPVGEPGILGGVEPSPDGKLILVHTIHKPWSYLHTWDRFPQDVEVWDLNGKVVYLAARLPLQDHVPIHGEPEGPREHGWRQTALATLVWREALDGGDPGRVVPYRDRLMMQEAPFEKPARELYRAPHRITSIWWGERNGLLLVEEYERERRWRHVWALRADDRHPTPRRVFDLSANERYLDPGNPVSRLLSDGRWVLAQEGDAIFLTGDGATPEGDRPFLDRFSLSALKGERLFRSDRSGYERFTGWLNSSSGSFLTRRESPTEVPNYFVRTLTKKSAGGVGPGEAEWQSGLRALTNYADPTPQIRGITKKIVTYQRADSTPLSFTLYLPPGYQEGTRLPTVVYAYPLEFSDPNTAGQVAGTDRQFTRIFGASPLFFLLDGYAVLDGVTMPVIGDPDTAYDTFVEQIVASAEAAIAQATKMGVTDPDRVGVIGHSHGALMTVTLLAHSDLFRAGIARSGAYNHTIRPFGFQGERRTLWQAPQTYIRLSPIMYADKIKEPLLLIHGEADQNPGTVPLQSEKLFEAVRGTKGTVRLVMLPFEQHGYQSKEAVEHVLAEQFNWFDRYVKNAGPRQKG